MAKTVKTHADVAALREEAHLYHNSDVARSTHLYAKARRWELAIVKREKLAQAAEIKPPFDTLGFIMAFEGGEVTQEEVIEGFQHLINNGMAWTLQGSYGRAAMSLIEQGLCTRPGA